MAGQRINGQPMEIGPLNDFAYTLYHDMNSMKQWAKFMNEAMDDHAKRLDHVMKDYASNIENTRADLTNTQDEMREALRMINQNDADIKAIVNSVSQELARELSNMKAGDAQLVNMVNAKLIEIEGKFLGVSGSGGSGNLEGNFHKLNDGFSQVAERVGNAEVALQQQLLQIQHVKAVIEQQAAAAGAPAAPGPASAAGSSPAAPGPELRPAAAAPQPPASERRRPLGAHAAEYGRSDLLDTGARIFPRIHGHDVSLACTVHPTCVFGYHERSPSGTASWRRAGAPTSSDP